MIRIRKFSPIDREYPIFEVTDQNDVVLFDVAMTDDGALEIGFHNGIAGQTLPVLEFKRLLNEAIGLASDKNIQ
ncbi:MAG TPA: hypothetical protein VKQ29_04465 [Aliidongia sp.]|nr:hypothetical protein [Aliidongia sp.]